MGHRRWPINGTIVGYVGAGPSRGSAMLHATGSLFDLYLDEGCTQSYEVQLPDGRLTSTLRVVGSGVEQFVVTDDTIHMLWVRQHGQTGPPIKALRPLDVDNVADDDPPVPLTLLFENALA